MHSPWYTPGGQQKTLVSCPNICAVWDIMGSLFPTVWLLWLSVYWQNSLKSITKSIVTLKPNYNLFTRSGATFLSCICGYFIDSVQISKILLLILDPWSSKTDNKITLINKWNKLCDDYIGCTFVVLTKTVQHAVTYFFLFDWTITMENVIHATPWSVLWAHLIQVRLQKEEYEVQARWKSVTMWKWELILPSLSARFNVNTANDCWSWPC